MKLALRQKYSPTMSSPCSASCPCTNDNCGEACAFTTDCPCSKASCTRDDSEQSHKTDTYPANSRMVTVSDGDNTLIITAYSAETNNRIVINSVDMSFGEFRQYLNTVGMVDEHEEIEKNRFDELIRVSQYTVVGIVLVLFSFSSWVALLVNGYSKISA